MSKHKTHSPLANQYDTLKRNPPASIKGRKIYCKWPTATLTKGKAYTVRNHFAYLRKMPLGNWEYQWHWYQFVTIKNDEGYTIKVNRSKFEDEITDALEVLQMAR